MSETVMSKEPNIAALYGAFQAGIGCPQRLNVIAEERGHSLAGAVIGHMDDVEMQRRLHRFHSQLMSAANTRGAVIELAGMRPNVGDEVVERLDRRLGVDGQEQRRARECHNRHEILLRIKDKSLRKIGPTDGS